MAATRTRSRVAVPIATRCLHVVGHPRRKVLVEIEKPFFADPEWRCTYSVRGAKLYRSRFACGEDSFQALMLAFVAIRAELDAFPVPLAWLSDEPGDIEIPHQAPTHAGLAFQRKVEQMIATAVHKEALNQIAAGKARQPAQRQKFISSRTKA